MGAKEKAGSATRAGFIAVPLTIGVWFAVRNFTNLPPDAAETTLLFFVCFLVSCAGDWLVKRLLRKNKSV
jgi:hypothetical protein